MVIRDVLKLLIENKTESPISKKESKKELADLSQIEIIEKIIKKLKNIANSFKDANVSNDDNILSTVYHLVSIQNNDINKILKSLKYINIESGNYNKDIYKAIKDIITLNGWKDDILEQLNSFFSERIEKENVGITYEIIENICSKRITNIDEFISKYTGVSPKIISEIGDIKGSSNPARGSYEVALALFSKNGYLNNPSKDKNGDITIDGKHIEVKAPKDGNSAHLIDQTNKLSISNAISNGNNAIKIFQKNIVELIKKNINQDINIPKIKKYPGFAILNTNNNQYNIFDKELANILLELINGNPTLNISEIIVTHSNSIKTYFINAIASIFKPLIIDGVDIKNTFKILFSDLDINFVLSSGRFINKNNGNFFKRVVGSMFLIQYQKIAGFDGIFIINKTHKDAIYISSKTIIENNPISLANVLDKSISFTTLSITPNSGQRRTSGIKIKGTKDEEY